MRCAAYCSASSYDISALTRHFQERSPVLLDDGTLHMIFETGDVFFFIFGVTVFWNLEESHEKQLLDQLRPFENEPLAFIESDYFSFLYGKPSRMHQDQIWLETDKDILGKFAVSHGLAQSVKLAAFEARIEKVISEVKKITSALVEKGMVPLSRKEISRKIGLLFFERSSINLHSDFLNPPDFFWEHPDLEPLYQMAAQDLTVRPRTQTLNRKLDIMHDLYQILGDELNHRHSTKLEWIIIVLIMIEVVLALTSKMDLFLNLFK